MPIQVVHNAPAASIAGLGALAGDAKRMMDLYPLLVQQDQFAQQLGHQDQMAMFEAAQQAARQQQALQINAQQQLARDQQNFAQQDYLQRQNILGHLLGQQNQAFIQDQLQGARANDWMLRDQQAQEARANLDAQHQARLLERRNAFEEEQLRRKEAQQWVDRFQDPFTEYEKNTANLMKQGLEYTPAQSEKLNKVKKDIAELQDRVASRRISLNDAMPNFQALHSQLLRISPSQQKMTAEEQVRSQLVPIWGKMIGPDGKPVDDPNNFLGMGAPDPKTGVPKLVVPNRPTGKGAAGEPKEGVLDKTQIEQGQEYRANQAQRQKQITAMADKIRETETNLPFDEAYKRAEKLVPDTWDPRYTPKHLQGGQPPPDGSSPGAEGAAAPPSPMVDPIQLSINDEISQRAVAGLVGDQSPEALQQEQQVWQSMQQAAASTPPDQVDPESQAKFKASYDRMEAVQVARALKPDTLNPQAVQHLTQYIQRVSGGKKTKEEIATLPPPVQKEILNLQLKLFQHLLDTGLLQKGK